MVMNETVDRQHFKTGRSPPDVRTAPVQDRTVAARAPDGKGLAFFDILLKISQSSICQQRRQLIETRLRPSKKMQQF
jgi:hypothetical protein